MKKEQILNELKKRGVFVPPKYKRKLSKIKSRKYMRDTLPEVLWKPVDNLSLEDAIWVLEALSKA